MKTKLSFFAGQFAAVAMTFVASNSYAQGPGIIDGGGVLDGGGILDASAKAGIIDGGGIVDGGGILDASAKAGIIDGGGVVDGGGILDRLPGSGIVDGGGVIDGGGVFDRFDQNNSTYTMNTNGVDMGVSSYNYAQPNAFYSTNQSQPGYSSTYGYSTYATPTVCCCDEPRRGLLRRLFR